MNLDEKFWVLIEEVVDEKLRGLVPEKLPTPDELANFLGVPVSRVYEQSRPGTILTIRPGRYIRFNLLCFAKIKKEER